MVRLRFENENTWFKALNSGRTDEFHARYEEAVKKVKGQLGGRHPHFIDGKEKYSDGGEYSDTSPNDTRMVLGYFQKGTAEDARQAIDAAKRAFPAWSATPYTQRVEILRRAAGIIRERKFELAALMGLENGKNRFEAVADVDEAIDMLEFYCMQMEVNNGFIREMGKAFPDETSRSILKPYGVWGVIGPFNFPLAIPTGMSCGALVTGNTVVFKPAEEAPFIGLRLYQALCEPGLPDGVFNYVTGPGETAGAELVNNPDVAGIAFTGSREVGVSAYSAFSRMKPRPFIAELGGKNPVIVTLKADLEKAAEGVSRAAFGYSGQKCSACSRVYVDKRVKGEFVAKLVEKIRAAKVGDPLLKETSLGPVISKRAYENYKRYIEAAGRDGRVVAGGAVLMDDEHRNGYFVEPTVVEGLPSNHQLLRDELFVPILCVCEVDSLDEAIRLSNDKEYGLTAAIFSKDEGEVKVFFDQIQAGVLYANRGRGASTGAMVSAQPFVGWKSSGSSGKGAGGNYYLQQFLREQTQTVCTR